ncbi:hypothetical protein ISCGN_012136 [Ixodes scapularis]
MYGRRKTLNTPVKDAFQVWCFSRACDRQLYRLRQELFYALLRQDAAWFDRHRSGEVANRMTEDMDRLREGMGDKVGLFVHYVSTFATGFATGFVESWELTLVIMSVTPLLAFASAFLGNVCVSGWCVNMATGEVVRPE